MRLHNRQVKAAFWDDPKLLRMERDARTLFHGLWHLADDSGCLEHDPFAFKTFLFRSPKDADLTEERLAELTDQLIAVELLVPYEAERKQCLFIRNFHKHQSLRSPAPPEVPLPPWVIWQQSEGKQRSGTYNVRPNDEGGSETVRQPYGPLTVSNGDHSKPKGNQARTRNEPEPEPEPEEEDNNVGSGEPTTHSDGVAALSVLAGNTASKSEYPAEFEAFWARYPRRINKKGAFHSWGARTKQGAAAADMITAADHYAKACEGKEEKFIMHPATFLGPNDRWHDFLDPSAARPEERATADRPRNRYQDPAAGGPRFLPNSPWRRGKGDHDEQFEDDAS